MMHKKLSNGGGGVVSGQWRMLEPVSEMELLSDLAEKHKRIACIGGFGGSKPKNYPSGDPTPIFLASIIRPGGKVTVVDCHDPALLQSLQEEIRRLKSKHEEVPDSIAKQVEALKFGQTIESGVGGFQPILDEVRELGLAERKIGFQPGLAWDTGLSPASQDMLLDRDTLKWVIRQSKTKKRLWVAPTLKHYLSSVKAGGDIVLMGVDRRKMVEGICGMTLCNMVEMGECDIDEHPITNSTYLIAQKEVEPWNKMKYALVIHKKK